MKLALQARGELQFAGSFCALGSLRPLINGDECTGEWTAEESGSGSGCFTVALEHGAFFRLAWTQEEGFLSLHYSLSGFADTSDLRSFGLRSRIITPLRAFLRNGYQSWDGSHYIEPHEDAAASPARGYAVTQLLARDSSQTVVLGFDRHDRFQQCFTFAQNSTLLSIETLWDEKARSVSEPCESERLIVLASQGAEHGLRAWAQLVAARARPAPRVPVPRIRGWCSWYSLYASISEQNILDHLQGARAVATRESLPLSIFQIDDGFTPEMGDWLDVKPQFPRGMKPLLDDIRTAGFKPGLWIAPFMVGNRSRLYEEHPDWVVRDRETGGPLAQMRFYGEFRWHKRSEEYYILDATHPAAMDWLREVFRVWREEWGCEYFKTDFMHFGSEHGPDRAVWHQPGFTRIEIWRRVAEMIREAIGDALWLGCGCPLWASVGLVDAVRIGRDVGVEWKGNHSAQSLLRDQATRNFGHNVLWQADPDCVLLRERFHHLADAEVRSLALYAGMTGGVLMTSDALHELSSERIDLFKVLLGFEHTSSRFPLLAAPKPHDQATNPEPRTAIDPIIVQIGQSSTGGATLLILNPTDEIHQRSYPLARLGLKPPMRAQRWNTQGIQAVSHPIDRLTLDLEPHDSALFFLSPAED